MNSAALQQALGVRAQQWDVCSAAVAAALSSDEMIAADHLYPALWSGSDGIRVLFYNGQFDLNCAAAGTLKFVAPLLHCIFVTLCPGTCGRCWVTRFICAPKSACGAAAATAAKLRAASCATSWSRMPRRSHPSLGVFF
jgi:hypothetical protein